MAPKAAEEEAPAADGEKAAEEQPRRKHEYVWKYGINDRVSGADSLPSSFQASGTLRGDYMQIAKAFGAVPHPAFKPRQAKGSKGRQGIVVQQQAAADGPEEERPIFTIQSMRMDRISAHILGLILPVATQMKVIRLLDCRLDAKMLRLLRRGLTGECSVECLQVEWNPIELDPLAGMLSPHAGALTEREGEAPGDEAGLALADFLDGDCVLECLSLRACALDKPQVAPLAAALARCPWQLRQLNLWENTICDQATEALATALEEYRGLEYLGLGRNRITDVGAATLCRPFASEILDGAAVESVRTRVKDQQERYDADVKAKAKAKPKAAPKPNSRMRREPIIFVDELEDRPPAPATDGTEAPSWVSRKFSELKALSLMENPIRNVSTLERLQPFGPRRAELAVLGTPAVGALLAKFPDLSTKERKAFVFPSSGQADVPGGAVDGWVLRLA